MAGKSVLETDGRTHALSVKPDLADARRVATNDTFVDVRGLELLAHRPETALHELQASLGLGRVCGRGRGTCRGRTGGDAVRARADELRLEPRVYWWCAVVRVHLLDKDAQKVDTSRGRNGLSSVRFNGEFGYGRGIPRGGTALPRWVGYGASSPGLWVPSRCAGPTKPSPRARQGGLVSVVAVGAQSFQMRLLSGSTASEL